MSKNHHYTATITWRGNKGVGTKNYRDYDRAYTIDIEGKATIKGSSDKAFLGDGLLHNPEDLLLASLSSCHMLWYLHLCAEADVIVTSYIDSVSGSMKELPDGSGYFEEVVLNPVVTVALADMTEKANALHQVAHKKCFIANSVNFSVRTEAKIVVAG